VLNVKSELFYKTGISILAAVLLKLLFFRIDEFLDIDIIFIAVIIIIVWEGNLEIDKRLNKKFSWLVNPQKRMLYHIVLCTLYTSLILFTSMYALHQLKHGDGELINPKMRETFTPFLFLSFTVIAISIGNQFFNSWKQSLVEVEKYKTANANAQLQNLKIQLNPHFLFNNLSVLTSLVHKNQDKAVDFINELSKVYRYVLDNKSSELVPLQEEINFLDHYIYLLKIRFENSIIFTLNIDKDKTNAFLPPMCLQMLVENTIQHNETSQANPLQVSIYTNQDNLIIENPIQPRSDLVDSSGTGLKNIQSRYSFFTDKKVEIINDGRLFKVFLPLIRKE
jgi:two-component system, LytTR family, sensor kinase